MAGFEVVVRPAVLPDIRPPPARSLPIEDAPDKGIAVINGIGNGIVDLTYSFSSSWSQTRLVEVRRTFSKVRVYASNADGTFDYDTYIEYEVLTAIEYLKNGQPTIGQQYAKPFGDAAAGVQIIQHGLHRNNSDI